MRRIADLLRFVCTVLCRPGKARPSAAVGAFFLAVLFLPPLGLEAFAQNPAPASEPAPVPMVSRKLNLWGLYGYTAPPSGAQPGTGATTPAAAPAAAPGTAPAAAPAPVAPAAATAAPQRSPGQAAARTRRPTASEEWGFTVGLGVGAAPDYEGGDDYEAVPIPLARVQKGERFGELRGLHVTSNLLNHPNWRVGPSLNFRDGYNDVDDDDVDDLENRGSSIEMGLKGGYVFSMEEMVGPNAALDLSLEFLHDVTDGHTGFLFTPSATLATPVASKWNLVAGLETTFASGAYMSHFFSVNAEEAARTGLDDEDADAGMKDVALNFGAIYQITDNWDFNILAQYKRMLGDAEDSPVVDDVGDANQFFGGVVISYGWGAGR